MPTELALKKANVIPFPKLRDNLSYRVASRPVMLRFIDWFKTPDHPEEEAALIAAAEHGG